LTSFLEAVASIDELKAKIKEDEAQFATQADKLLEMLLSS
jgi:hypothetical protein